MRRHPALLAAALLPLVAALAASPALAAPSSAPSPAPAAHQALAAGGRCADLTVRAPSGTTIDSLEATRDAGGTLEFPAQPGYPAPPPPVTDVPAFCRVVVTLTHHHAEDRERIEVWLPESGWSGRFQALGGAGYSAGNFGPDLAEAVKDGYAVGTTDAGATPVTGWTSPWALTDDGRVDRTILKSFAGRSSHELALVGKAAAKAFYRTSPAYSYWNGCSTGGRQGYVEAQQHPDDFDGILAGAPAVSWDRFAVATLWPHVVMNQEHDLMSECELAAFTAAAVQACDPLDGVTDGIIADPRDCAFDPRTLVGKTVDCDDGRHTLTATDARVVRKIWDGPTTTTGQRLWYGPTRGADLSALGGSMPFPVAESWVKDFVARDRDLDVSTIDYRRYQRLFAQSVLEYHHVIGSDDTDLSAFRRAGGKLLSWHGLADQLVPVEGTIRYYDRVDARTPGSPDDFYRLFLAPGAVHCGSGAGPAPTDPLAALVSWVEDGDAPETLPATTTRADGTVVRRELCSYPAEPRYRGTGDPDAATGYRCVAPR